MSVADSPEPGTAPAPIATPGEPPPYFVLGGLVLLDPRVLRRRGGGCVVARLEQLGPRARHTTRVTSSASPATDDPPTARPGPDRRRARRRPRLRRRLPVRRAASSSALSTSRTRRAGRRARVARRPAIDRAADRDRRHGRRARRVLRARVRLGVRSRREFGARVPAALLGAGAFLTITLVPFTKYPANPPGVGDPDTIDTRTALFVAMIVISLVCRRRRGGFRRQAARSPRLWNASLLAIGAYIAVIAVAQLILPVVHETPNGFPADVLYRFRLASLGINLTLWTAIGLGFGAAAERCSRRPRGVSRGGPGGRTDGLDLAGELRARRELEARSLRAVRTPGHPVAAVGPVDPPRGCDPGVRAVRRAGRDGPRAARR